MSNSSEIINTGLLRAASYARQRYSAMMPSEMFVIPNPDAIIHASVEYPIGTVGEIILFTNVTQPIKIPAANITIPTRLTSLSGAKEKETKESINNFIFLANVHFEAPANLSL